jgi:hypothetical protein
MNGGDQLGKCLYFLDNGVTKEEKEEEEEEEEDSYAGHSI